jgi:hypothetical protein
MFIQIKGQQLRSVYFKKSGDFGRTLEPIRAARDEYAPFVWAEKLKCVGPPAESSLRIFQGIVGVD